MQSQNDKVINYAMATARNYKAYWYSHKDLAFHFGYYDKVIKQHSEALVKMNEMISGLANVMADDYILDAGCGIGGTSIWLAKNKGCRAVGINIVSFQLQMAILNALDRHVSDLVEFKKEDYTKTSFLDKTFTIVWGQEAVCHTDHKEKFIQEAYRVLQDEGRLVLAEYILREDPKLTAKEQQQAETWLDGWAMHSLLTLTEYKKLIEAAGFSSIEVYDLTANVKPSLRRLARLTYLFIPFVSFFVKFNLDQWLSDQNQLILRNIQASYLQYKLLKSNGWKHMLIIAHK